ncbi:MAG: hypothetical protein WCO35_02045 [Candidatus Nomurabacteria bacterium]
MRTTYDSTWDFLKENGLATMFVVSGIIILFLVISTGLYDSYINKGVNGAENILAAVISRGYNIVWGIFSRIPSKVYAFVLAILALKFLFKKS